jgi:tetratricopeptide (TPR) repeat protein
MQTTSPQLIEPERIATEVVAKHLEKIEFSDTFNGLEHQRRLVRYLVEQRIAGRQDQLSQSEIVGAKLLAAASTRSKPEMLFPDEQAVRTHMSRLRKSLLAYYKYDAPTEAFQIDIPKGKYVAMFSPVSRTPVPARAGRARHETTPAFQSSESLNKTAVGLYRQGHYEEAELVLKRVLEIREQSLGPNHPDTATSLNNLAMLFEKQGRHQEAMPLLERALHVCEKALGPDHPETMIGLNNLAIGHMNQARYNDAAIIFERALAVRERSLGPDHPDTATSLNNLAMLYEKQGRYKEALPLLERALAVREHSLGPDHPDTANSLNNLAMVYKTQARFKEAVALSQRALDICERMLGPDHPQTATVRSNYVELNEGGRLGL